MQTITRVRTTFNGAPNGAPREYALAPKTVVFGPTGAGKTTLLASLGLLLTGNADDAVGRPQVAAGADLALAMADDADDLSIEAETGDGRTLRYKLERGKRPAGWPHAADWRHPVRELRARLAQGPDAARRSMAPLLLGLDPLEMHRLLPRQLHGEVPASLTIDGLAEQIDEASKALKAVSAEVKTRASNVETLEATLPVRPSPTALDALRRAVEQRRAADAQVAEARGARVERVRSLRASAAAATAERARLVAEQAGLIRSAEVLVAEARAVPAKAAAYQQALAEHRARVATEHAIPAAPPAPFTEEQEKNLRAYQRILAVGKEDECPLCRTKTQIGPLRAHVQTFLDKYDAWARAVATFDAAVAAAPAAAEPMPDYRDAAVVQAEYAAITERFAAVSKVIAEIDVKLAETQQQIGEIEAHPEPTAPAGPHPAELLAAAQQAEQLSERGRALRAELLEMQQRESTLSLLVDELRRVLELAYRERVQVAVDGVSRYLPAGYRLELMLQAPNGARVFRFGLRAPGGRAEMNPSGGKRMALLLALACWLVEQRRIDVPDGMIVVMPSEERAFSPEWLGKVMTALADAPVQIVICNLVKPTYRGKVWRMVELSTADEPASASGGEEEAAAASGGAAPAAPAAKRSRKTKGTAAAGTADTVGISDPTPELGLTWSEVRADPILRKQFAAAIPTGAEGGGAGFLRASDGAIRGCARIATGDAADCALCGGDCPDDLTIKGGAL